MTADWRVSLLLPLGVVLVIVSALVLAAIAEARGRR